MTDTIIAEDIELRSPDALIPYTNNPKEHPDEQVDKIASSIKNYGWDQPIVVDAEGEIIKGHGRLQAAKRLGLDEVPVIERDDLTDAEKRASRIADNKTAESAWDDELLTSELDMVTGEFEEMELGFGEDEIDDLFTAVEDTSFLDEGISTESDGVVDDENDPQSKGGDDTPTATSDSSINASTFVELTFSVTPEERAEINEVLASTASENRREQLLEVITEY